MHVIVCKRCSIARSNSRGYIIAALGTYDISYAAVIFGADSCGYNIYLRALAYAVNKLQVFVARTIARVGPRECGKRVAILLTIAAEGDIYRPLCHGVLFGGGACCKRVVAVCACGGTLVIKCRREGVRVGILERANGSSYKRVCGAFILAYALEGGERICRVALVFAVIGEGRIAPRERGHGVRLDCESRRVGAFKLIVAIIGQGHGYGVCARVERAKRCGLAVV